MIGKRMMSRGGERSREDDEQDERRRGMEVAVVVGDQKGSGGSPFSALSFAFAVWFCLQRKGCGLWGFGNQLWKTDTDRDKYIPLKYYPS